MALPIILAAGAWGATKFGAGAVKGVAGGAVKGAAGVGKGVVGGAFSATKFIASLPKKILGTMINGPTKILGFLGKIIGKPLGLLGISTSVSSLLRQSQIFTGSVGALLQMVGAFIDIMIAPFMPYFASLMKKMGTWIPKIQEVSLKFHEYVVGTIFPWIKDLPKNLVEKFGFNWSDVTTWWDRQTWKDWMDDPVGMFKQLWEDMNVWENIKTNVWPVLKKDLANAFTSAMETYGKVSDIVKDILYGKKLDMDEFMPEGRGGGRAGGGLIDKIKGWWADIDWDLTATKFLTAIGFSSEDITTIKDHWKNFKNEWMPRIEGWWKELVKTWVLLKEKWGDFTDWWATVDWKATADALVYALGILGAIGKAMMVPMLWIAQKMGLEIKRKAHTDKALAAMGEEERRMVGMEPGALAHKFKREEVASELEEKHSLIQMQRQGDMQIIRWFTDLFKKPEVSGLGPSASKAGPKLLEDWEQLMGGLPAQWGQPTGTQFEQQMATINQTQALQMGQVSAQTIALSSATTDMVTTIKNTIVNSLQSITDHLITLQPTLGVNVSTPLTSVPNNPQDRYDAGVSNKRQMDRSNNQDQADLAAADLHSMTH